MICGFMVPLQERFEIGDHLFYYFEIQAYHAFAAQNCTGCQNCSAEQIP
jgi:hypothetical protein